MFWSKKKSKSYPLIVKGDVTTSYRYSLIVYSGKHKLKMLLDSGAEQGTIIDTSLAKCSYYKVGVKKSIAGITGNYTDSEIVLIDFDLDKSSASKGIHKYNLGFSVITDNKAYKGSFDGILGTDFLKFCVVDFRKGILTVYSSE